MSNAIGYAASGKHSKLKRVDVDRDPPKENEVRIDILFCGVCHSDIHQVKDDWSNTVYPCMPGHEIVGTVAEVGAAVTRHAVGDLVGVGCMIDSCRACDPCRKAEENYCEGSNSWLATYNGPMVPAKKAGNGENAYGRDNTYGGYSTAIVVPEDFVLKIPANLEPQVAAPILCAGVTTYSPMKHWGVGPGQKIGIVGLGGLGHLAAKIAKALGAAEVIGFTSTKEKIQDMRELGFEAIVEKDEDAFKAHEASFDFILSTIPEGHDIDPYVKLLKRDRTICVAGAVAPMKPVDNTELIFHRRHVAGSLIGSLAETQEVLDLCAKHGIGPEVEIIDIASINDAYKRVEKGDVRFRYVIDIDSLRIEAGQ